MSGHRTLTDLSHKRHYGNRDQRGCTEAHHKQRIASIQVIDDRPFAAAALYSHKSAQVKDAIVNFIRDPPNSFRQTRIKAFRKYQALIEDPAAYLESTDDLKTYFDIFDDMFFFSALRAHTSVKLGTYPPDMDASRSRRGGSTISYRNRRLWNELPLSDECEIIIFRVSEPHTNGRTEMLGCLIRHMIVAMLGLYVCRRHENCKTLADLTEGNGTHGYLMPFQVIAREIEEVSAKMPGGLLDTKRLDGLARMVARSKGLQISDDQLREWGLDADEFRASVRQHSEERSLRAER